MLISVNMVLICILGGKGTIAGPVIGAILIVAFNEFFVATLGASEINILATGLIMMICLMFFPLGIVGTLAKHRKLPAIPGLGLRWPRLCFINAPQSTCSQRVRYALHAKDIAFEEVKLDLFSGDQLKPDYLAINPNGVVPALVHDGEPVIDSAVILEYLEDILPMVAPMRPTDPRGAAQVRAMMRFVDEVPTPAVRIPSYNLAFLPAFSGDVRSGISGALRQQAP